MSSLLRSHSRRRVIGALPSCAAPEQPDRADKGQLGGSCNRQACQAPGATWWNAGTRAYYCAACAHEINRANPDATTLYGHQLCLPEKPAW